MWGGGHLVLRLARPKEQNLFRQASYTSLCEDGKTWGGGDKSYNVLPPQTVGGGTFPPPSPPPETRPLRERNCPQYPIYRTRFSSHEPSNQNQFGRNNNLCCSCLFLSKLYILVFTQRKINSYETTICIIHIPYDKHPWKQNWNKLFNLLFIHITFSMASIKLCYNCYLNFPLPAIFDKQENPGNVDISRSSVIWPR